MLLLLLLLICFNHLGCRRKALLVEFLNLPHAFGL